MIDQAPQSQLRFALAILGIITTLCIAAGTFLLVKGYQSGELFVGIAGSSAGAIAGMLSMRQQGTPTTSSGAVATEVTNTGANPVNVTESEPHQPPPAKKTKPKKRK